MQHKNHHNCDEGDVGCRVHGLPNHVSIDQHHRHDAAHDEHALHNDDVLRFAPVINGGERNHVGRQRSRARNGKQRQEWAALQHATNIVGVGIQQFRNQQQ